MAKTKDPDAVLENSEFDLFAALAAIDRKDYDYWKKLSTEQQRKFAPYMLLIWTSAVKGDADIQDYYLRSTDIVANKYFLHEAIVDHPQLQWQMLCASSPGMGKQFHQWIPQLSNKKINLSEKLSDKEAVEYFTKIGLPNDAALHYAALQRKASELGELFGRFKIDDLTQLAELTNDEEIEDYYRQLGE